MNTTAKSSGTQVRVNCERAACGFSMEERTIVFFQILSRLRTFARKVSNIDFFPENFTFERWLVSDVRNVKKNVGSPTSFWREHAQKNT